MKVLLGLACVLATSGAVAQTTTTTTTVETTKSVRMDLGKPYANLDLRHYNGTVFSEKKSDEVLKTDVFVQSRATIGSKWVNDKVDTSLLLKYTILDGSTKVTTANPKFSVKVTAYSGSFGSVVPYASYTPSLSDKFASEGDVGLAYSLPNIDLGSGFAINGGLDTWATFYGGDAKKAQVDVLASKNSKTKAKNKETGADLKVAKSDPDVGIDASLALGYTVPTLSDLSFSLGTLYHTDIKAEYSQKANGQIDSEYKDTAYTESHFLVAYKITDALKLDNAFFYYNEDFYGDEAVKTTPGADTRFLNRLRLSYKLF